MEADSSQSPILLLFHSSPSQIRLFSSKPYRENLISKKQHFMLRYIIPFLRGYIALAAFRKYGNPVSLDTVVSQ